jgi:hypothetical protein
MKKNRITESILVVFSICLSLVVAESLMRLFYEQTSGFNLDEIAEGFAEFDYSPPVNELGFREDKLSDEILDDNYRRILFLGDSFTFGHGIRNGEDRFSDIIEKRLNKNLQDNEYNYHIYNAGVGGTEPRDWVPYLKTLLPVYKPQYVFTIFFLRDGATLCTSLWCYKRKIRQLKSKYEDTVWYKYSDIGKFIGNRLVERDFSDYYVKRIINAYTGTEEQKKVWIEQRKYLRKIRNICRNNRVEHYLIVFPMLIGLESNYQFHGVEREITRFANANDIPVFSLTDGFIGQESRSLWVSPGDQHPNEKGHLIAGNILYPYVRKVLGEGERI